MTTKRYAPAEVQAALAETERMTFTPHSQIVLAAEVLALRRLILQVSAELDTEADTIVGAIAKG